MAIFDPDIFDELIFDCEIVAVVAGIADLIHVFYMDTVTRRMFVDTNIRSFGVDNRVHKLDGDPEQIRIFSIDTERRVLHG